MLFFTAAYVGPPRNFSITVEGTETLTFSWDIPLEITPEEIEYYVIECNPRFQHDITSVVINAQTVTLSEFLPGTKYTCTVRAKYSEFGAPAVGSAVTEEGKLQLVIVNELYLIIFTKSSKIIVIHPKAI